MFNCPWNTKRSWEKSINWVRTELSDILIWNEVMLLPRLTHCGSKREAYDIDGLVQEKRNFSALAMELQLSSTNPSICKAGYRSFV